MINPESIQKIKDGFKIKRVVMKDADTQELYWDSQNHDNLNQEEITIKLDSKIIESKAAQRVIEFSTKEQLKNLELVQNAYLGKHLIETMSFKFGFVIPDSDNCWDSTVVNRPSDQMIPKEVQSGKLVVEFLFKEQNITIYSIKIKVFYT